MIDLLEEAFAEAAKLPPSEQEALAAWILAELADERDWQRAFSETHAALDRLADEALDEYHTGRTSPVSF